METPQSDFKWFGEGFEGFPKILPENCIEYRLYINDGGTFDIPDGSSRWTAVLEEASKLRQTYLQGYIWQQDDFSLELKTDDGRYFMLLRENHQLTRSCRFRTFIWPDGLLGLCRG
jgi:hypothetical protein